ncbi:hypothetical protein B0T26DRAFT_165946 [Lasiosphaeria miniovina]|uniref:Uncharacterized protein n=1 Tax=Lasiosphaeria miniovina TaxID=1954250 RepID=A0AA40E4V4_9PEZI|nr:uncharacterized protein B0T26DRAFT_165946 [Lasiosphaeria miniovina]KAK0728269.1 hypothetical protein B0T26DRAFT_165946 [Lasiosphaeria miniovina]
MQQRLFAQARWRVSCIPLSRVGGRGSELGVVAKTANRSIPRAFSGWAARLKIGGCVRYFFWLIYGKQVCRAKRDVEKENGGGQAGRTCRPVRSCRRKGYGNQESGHRSSKEAMLARPDKDGFPLDRTDAAASFEAQVGMDKGSGEQAVGSLRARTRARARRAVEANWAASEQAQQASKLCSFFPARLDVVPGFRVDDGRRASTLAATTLVLSSFVQVRPMLLVSIFMIRTVHSYLRSQEPT